MNYAHVEVAKNIKNVAEKMNRGDCLIQLDELKSYLPEMEESVSNIEVSL